MQRCDIRKVVLTPTKTYCGSTALDILSSPTCRPEVITSNLECHNVWSHLTQRAEPMVWLNVIKLNSISNSRVSDRDCPHPTRRQQGQMKSRSEPRPSAGKTCHGPCPSLQGYIYTSDIQKETTSPLINWAKQPLTVQASVSKVHRDDRANLLRGTIPPNTMRWD